MLIAESVTAVAAWGAPHCWTVNRRSCLHPRPAGAAHAQTVDRSAYSPKVKQSTGRERVLRYIDGRERCIRYPLTATDIDAQSDQIDVTHSYEEDWDPDRWDDIDWPWEACGLWEGAASGNAVVATPVPAPPVQESQALQKVTSMLTVQCVLDEGGKHLTICAFVDTAHLQHPCGSSAHSQCNRISASTARSHEAGPEQL